MGHKVLTSILLVIFFCTGMVHADTAQDYIDQGRALMLDGTLTGVRQACQVFGDGLNDAACSDCASHRELTFLHVLMRTGMLVIRDDGQPVDSVIELTRDFGIDILGDSLMPFGLDLEIAFNDHGSYEIPQGAPNADELRLMLDTRSIPEVDAIIAELDTIHDSPEDPFRMYFYPHETHLAKDLEVDYAEVLIMKAILVGIKAQLVAESAYDIFVDPNDPLVEKVYGECFDLNADLLEAYPDFLKVLPTDGHPQDGKALLAQARQDVVVCIDYYFQAIDYIRAEEDDQEDDLLYIDPQAHGILDLIAEKLTTIRDSLVDDTPITQTISSTKTYDIKDVASKNRGELTLEYDPFEMGDGGRFTFELDNGMPTVWEIDSFIMDDESLYAEMEFEEYGLEYCYQNTNNLNSLLFTPETNTPYKVSELPSSLFTETGVAQEWHGDDSSWSYTLPFSFPYYGSSYTTVNVCSNGFLDFASSIANEYDAIWQLRNNLRIAPLWEQYLRTDGIYDIYIDESVPNEVKIRWHADYYYSPGANVNFSVTLFSNGNIRFDYGTCDRYIYKTVGISAGNGNDYIAVGGRWWGSGLLTGNVSNDHSIIANASFETWGDSEESFEGLHGLLTNSETQEVTFDLNPIFGSSPRYPDPVNLRDLLPEFDQWSQPLPDSVAKGLNYDATLGGIIVDPALTQYDWNLLGNLQPSGLINFDFVNASQIQLDGDTGDWEEDQLVFTDISGDTDQEDSVTGVDIKNLYIAYDSNYLYGAITYYDDFSETCEYYPELILSYIHDEPKSLGSIRFKFYQYGGDVSGELCEYIDNSGWEEWDCIADIEAVSGQNSIEFKIPLSEISAYLPGRFITLKSKGYDYDWYESDGETNKTRLQIGDLGSISGTVTYDDYQSGPIFIQAYTDPDDPEGSLVASTMIDAPGPYILENVVGGQHSMVNMINSSVTTLDDTPVNALGGVGLGWRGYVRAFTPYYGFNIFDPDADMLEMAIPIHIMQLTTTGIDFTLDCLENDFCGKALPLQENVISAGTTIGATGEDITSVGCDDCRDVWHSFTPSVDGVYLFSRDSAEMTSTLAVYDSCHNKEELAMARGCDSELHMNVRAGKTYLIRIAGLFGQTGDYSVTVSYYGLPVANDFCQNAIVLAIEPDNSSVTYEGTTFGATGEDLTSFGCDDNRDVWHSFTPATDGIYQITRDSETMTTTMVIYDSCNSKEGLAEARGCDSELSINARAGETYLIRIAGNHGETGDYSVMVTYNGPPVANDLCQDAIAMNLNVSYAGDMTGATGTDITSRGCDDSLDVWHSLTTPVAGIYKISRTSDHSTTLAVFVDCQADEIFFAGYCYSDLYFNAQAGQTYLIRIAGTDDQAGPYTLIASYDHAPLANDEIFNAVPIYDNVPHYGSTSGATGNDITSRVCNDPYDLWHAFVPERSGNYHITIDDNGLEQMRVAVFTSWPLWTGSLSEVTCCRPCRPDSYNFYAVAGAAYYLRVAGKDNASGMYALTVSSIQPLWGDISGNGSIDLMDLIMFAPYWLEDSCAGSNLCQGADLNYSGKVDLNDFARLVQNWLKGTGQ